MWNDFDLIVNEVFFSISKTIWTINASIILTALIITSITVLFDGFVS